MKYKLIKETDKIKLIKAKDIVCYAGFGEPVKKDESQVPVSDVNVERDIIKTKIFTDGQIKEITPIEASLSYLPKKLSNIRFDEIESSELELSNHTYVIRVLTALEVLKLRKAAGLFEIIKEVEIYLKDKKDKDAINAVKKTLEILYKKCDCCKCQSFL